MKQHYLYLLCAALLAGCGKTKNAKTDAAQDRMQHRIEHNEVTVDTLQRRDFMRELISNGRLAASKRSTLSFEVSGTIAAIDAKNGSRVGAGEPIARIDAAGAGAPESIRATTPFSCTRRSWHWTRRGWGFTTYWSDRGTRPATRSPLRPGSCSWHASARGMPMPRHRCSAPAAAWLTVPCGLPLRERSPMWNNRSMRNRKANSAPCWTTAG